ncbi:unnamed protein product [Microthlaspi erraticum]|uniref:Uncharacterized protein n=1 Tax=Microthlaspi erraticum TaxID=1685480 RepID=A0A6D2L8G2_9BRAS|nr:unnamed protein product [Microthlaspi erraticum]
MVLVNVHSDGQPIFINKDMLTWYLLSLKLRQKLQTKNQQSEPVQDHNLRGLPKNTTPDQYHSMQNHQETHSEPDNIEVIEERPRETTGDSWVISIRDKLKQAHRDDDTTIWGKLCIYRVPNYLQENDNKSYFPQTVSLGPYHHGKKRLRSMEQHKWRAVNRVLKRTKHRIEIYIDAMRKLEEKARACYQGSIGLTSNEFTEMLVLDGCFVLELFRGTVEGFPEIGYAPNDPVFAMRGLMHSIQRDMIMLENQLPLFVLDRLLELQLGTQNQTGIVAHVAVRFFDPLMPTGEAFTQPDQSKLMNWLEKSLDSLGDKGELHCLDVFRQSLLRSSPIPGPRSKHKRSSRDTRVVDKRQQQLVHCVTELREAGVKFRTRKTDRFWDIEFKNGYLEIPKLLIHDGTKSLFSNLIAFEQCHINSTNNITSYIIFMDNLINSSEDVSYLHYCGIIEHWLGSDAEVADLFNRLCQEVVFDPKDSYLSRLSDDVNRYYSRIASRVKEVLQWSVRIMRSCSLGDDEWIHFKVSSSFYVLCGGVFRLLAEVFFLLLEAIGREGLGSGFLPARTWRLESALRLLTTGKQGPQGFSLTAAGELQPTETMVSVSVAGSKKLSRQKTKKNIKPFRWRWGFNITKEVRCFRELTRPEAYSEPGEINATDEKLSQIREEWVVSIEEKIKKALKDDDTTSWDNLCIYRVPHYLQENDKKSYFPHTVSLGPYHLGKEHLIPMDHHKLRAVDMVIKRTNQSIKMYISAMKELEDKARACYQGPIKMNSDDFIEMLVFDGCFVLELFKGTVEGFLEIGYAPNDPVFAMRGLMHSIQRDMVMLENQLPLFVLNRLLEVQLGTRYQTGSVAELAVQFFHQLMPMGEPLTKRDLQGKSADSLVDYGELHCLDVFHRSLFWTPKPKRPQYISSRNQQLVHCVTELTEAGIKFKTKKTDQLWDIEFEHGYLKIPKLLIHDGTKTLFSNLIAFEQCHIHSSNNVTSYIIFMDNLINSAEDVRYLHHCGIIEHWLGSDSEVADLFNQLCKEVSFDPNDSYLSKLSDKVNCYYSRKWNSLKATLRHKYFNNPWAYFSFIAAVILLILTFSQSFYAVYAYYKPNS